MSPRSSGTPRSASSADEVGSEPTLRKESSATEDEMTAAVQGDGILKM
jgi:hypothetical protein